VSEWESGRVRDLEGMYGPEGNVGSGADEMGRTQSKMGRKTDILARGTISGLSTLCQNYAYADVMSLVSRCRRTYQWSS